MAGDDRTAGEGFFVLGLANLDGESADIGVQNAEAAALAAAAGVDFRLVREAMLGGCDALVLECNHDLGLLEHGDYPYPLKQRIAGRLGHLHNEAAADILAFLQGFQGVLTPPTDSLQFHW